MTKREFQKIINENLEGLSLEKQKELLHKMEYKWLPEITGKLDRKLSNNYVYCSNCKKYALKKDLKLLFKEVEFKDQVVFIDAGYGDNDEFADVTYLVNYYTCPYCKADIEKSKMYLSEKNRHSK